MRSEAFCRFFSRLICLYLAFHFSTVIALSCFPGGGSSEAREIAKAFIALLCKDKSDTGVSLETRKRFEKCFSRLGGNYKSLLALGRSAKHAKFISACHELAREVALAYTQNRGIFCSEELKYDVLCGFVKQVNVRSGEWGIYAHPVRQAGKMIALSCKKHIGSGGSWELDSLLQHYLMKDREKGRRQYAMLPEGASASVLSYVVHFPFCQGNDEGRALPPDGYYPPIYPGDVKDRRYFNRYHPLPVASQWL